MGTQGLLQQLEDDPSMASFFNYQVSFWWANKATQCCQNVEEEPGVGIHDKNNGFDDETCFTCLIRST